MTELFLLAKILTCLSSVLLAVTVISRDPDLRENRLLAWIPICTAVWSFCEILWNIQTDPRHVKIIVGLSGLGWMMLGPVCLHIFSVLVPDSVRSVRRLLLLAYGLSIVSVGIYVFTSWGLAETFRVSWGWSYHFGPVFPAIYLACTWPLTLVLASWGKVLPRGSAHNDRAIWLSIYISVITAVLIATVTDVLLPLFGHHVPPIGSTSIALVALVMAQQFRRHGYSLMSPGAYASEILGSLRDGVVLLRPNGDIHLANGAFERLTDCRIKSLVGHPASTWIPSLRDDPALLTAKCETELVDASGESIPVLVTPTRELGARRRHRARSFVVRDLREVTALRDRLVSSERLAAVGELSTSLGDEILEPVLEMRSHLERMRLQTQDLIEEVTRIEASDELQELARDREDLIEESLEGVERIVNLLHEVRGFSSERSRAPEVNDVSRLAGDALRIASARASARTHVTASLGDPAYVSCVADEIVQVVVNLLVNAFQAVGDSGGAVSLSSRREGSNVHLTVRDEGAGVEPAVADRVFDPFFTTKPVGEGTGLGLAISQHIARRHGGVLLLESESGEGACFTVVLPAASRRPGEEWGESSAARRGTHPRVE